MTRRKPASKAAAFAEWATSTPRVNGGQKCPACHNREVREAIEAVLAVRRQGSPTVSKRQLWARLCEVFEDYTGTWNSFRDHVDKHTEGWNGRL